MSNIKHIDIKEFREKGYLQEANRQFFHPLGLALEVVVEDDGTERLGGVWDYRDDPEGIWYDFPTWAQLDEVERKADFIEQQRKRYENPRKDLIENAYGIRTSIEPAAWPKKEQ